MASGTYLFAEPNVTTMSDDAFYLRYYVGHKDGNFGGVEYMEVSGELLQPCLVVCGLRSFVLSLVPLALKPIST